MVWMENLLHTGCGGGSCHKLDRFCLKSERRTKMSWTSMSWTRTDRSSSGGTQHSIKNQTKSQKIWWKGGEWVGQGPDVHLQEGPSSSSLQPALSVRPLELPDRSPVRRKVFEEPKTLLVGQTTICMWYRWQRQCLNCSKAKFERSSIQLIFTEKNVVGKKGKYVRSQTRRSRTKYAKLCVSYLIQGYQLLFGRSYVRCTCARLIAKVWPQERKYS